MDERGYRHGDRVRDVRSGLTGTVREEGCATAEVTWDNLCVSDELDVAIANGLTRE